MINRRELIASGIAVSLAAQNSAAKLAGFAANNGAEPALHFLADAGLIEARAAADAAAASGANVVWLGNDLTPVYEWLDLALRPAPFAIAGLTSAHDFFVLERIAWDRNLRTIEQRALAAGANRIAAVEWRLEPRSRR
jgi:hypothetical protein